nr:efflux RND transporter periplasmic adaptor subunit [Mesorhizobium sp. M00.F.Ca.ET.216.01.1.1]
MAAVSNNSSSGSAVYYRIAFAEERRIIDSVQATGAVTPVALVSVSSQISGQIKELNADFNKEVRRGDVLAVIDPLGFQIAVEQSEAQLGIAMASVQKAEIALRQTQADFDRKKALAGKGVGAQADSTIAEATRDIAAADLENSRHALKGAEAAVKQAHADLDRTVIRSPVYGTIIVRNVEVGTTVAASLQAPVLFTIAQDLRQMQINTSIPEAEIGRIRPGQRVEFTVDAFKGRTFEGEVVQIRKQPQITQNVVTYTVVANAPNENLLLLPGMTATARIIIDDNEKQLAVPNAALRFHPPGQPRGVDNAVYVQRDGALVGIPVQLGATDGAFTAITAEALRPGNSVVTGLSESPGQGAQKEQKVLGVF